MNHQRAIRQSLNRADASLVQTAFFVLLQMNISNRNRHCIHPRFTGELRRFIRIGTGRILSARIAHKSDLAFTRNPCRMRQCRNGSGFIDILRQRLARAVKHQRGKTAVQRLLAFLKRIAMIKMRHHGHRSRFGQMTEHFSQNRQRRMRPARGASLQNHR